MKGLLVSIGAVALFGSAALADDVEIRVPGPVIEHRATNEGTTTSKTVEHSDGCTTRSVTHTDADKDRSVTHTKTNC